MGVNFLSKAGVGNLRRATFLMSPACGWNEAKPVFVFGDKNREIKDILSNNLIFGRFFLPHEFKIKFLLIFVKC